MEHIIIDANETLRNGAVWDFYFGGRTVGVLDIETTGLDRARCRFVLGGLYDCAEGTLHQIFADSTEEEAEALALFMGEVNRFDVLITYNGRHFDMPFLEERVRRVQTPASATGIIPRYPGPAGPRACCGYDLDLYQVVNGHSPIRRFLPNLRQKTVESYMGLWQDRSDEISGAESVELYYHYMSTGDREARRQILLHNSDDVLQLTRLVRVIDKCDFHSAMYKLGFPVGSPDRRWQVRKIGITGNVISLQGIQGAGAIDYRSFELDGFPLQTLFDAKAGSFRMEFPIVRQSGIAAADIRAAGLDEKEFEKYPGFGSGFLVVEEQNAVKYREINHLIQSIIKRFEERRS